TIDSEVVIAGPNTGDNAYIFGSPGQNERRVSGSLPQGHKSFMIRGSLPNPALFLASAWYQYLAENEVQTSGYTVEFQPVSTLNLLCDFKSPELTKLVKLATTHSI